MSWWQILLFPFAIIYDLITRSRNWLFDIGLKRIHAYPELLIISVGNLSVGGTGKTPMVEYLIRYGLTHDWKIATLSRGYGRETKGVQIADSTATPKAIGDESFGYFEQFGKSISVVVAEKRVLGIEAIIENIPKVNVVLLDDAYQHRYVLPNVSFLMTTLAKPYWKDFVLPSGRLRESRKGDNRADLLVITKSVELIEPPINIPYAQSAVKYGELILLSGDKRKKVVTVAGLSNADDFFIYTSNKYQVISQHRFADHYSYKLKDVLRLVEFCQDNDAVLITTYKDAVKIKSFEELNDISWGYVPIEMSFISGENYIMNLLDGLNEKLPIARSKNSSDDKIS